VEQLMADPRNNLELPTSFGEKAGPMFIRRWSATRKGEVVARLLRGKSLDAVSGKIGIEVQRLERWRDKALNRYRERRYSQRCLTPCLPEFYNPHAAAARAKTTLFHFASPRLLTC
jgi:transposase-like protein